MFVTTDRLGGGSVRVRTPETDVREYRFEDDGRIPNNPTLPLLVYPQALAEHDRNPSRAKVLLAGNGWGGSWVDGVFPYHHYHSVSHEVLIVVGGSAEITFGGPEGETVEVEAGDVVVIPAGVGHCREGSGGGFSVVSGLILKARRATTCAPARRASARRCWRTSAASRCPRWTPSLVKGVR
jgi:uncharacterized protein YjlB